MWQIYTVKGLRTQQEQEDWNGKDNREEEVFCSQGAGSSGSVVEGSTGKAPA